MPRNAWKDEFVIKTYELAKSGVLERHIARIIGVNHGTLISWKKKKPIFNDALKQGKREYNGGIKGADPHTLREYVYKRLPRKLKRIWLRLNRLDKKKSGVEKIDALFEKHGKVARQHLFIYAWTMSHFFSVSKALKKVGISKKTLDKWRENDPDFAELVDEINWHKKNFCEDALMKCVAAGDSSAIVFVNKTLNRDRGYGERTEVNINTTSVTQNVVYISELNLPAQTEREILERMREKKQIESKTVNEEEVREDT